MNMGAAAYDTEILWPLAMARVFQTWSKMKKNELAAVSGATTKAFATKFRVARGSRIYKNVNTVPKRVRGSFGNVKVYIYQALSVVGMDGHPVVGDS